MAIQSDGKIVVAGTAGLAPSGFDFAIARYNADGSLDTSFDGDGKVLTDFSVSGDSASDVAIQSDGKIVVAGVYLNPVPFKNEFALARYNSDGSLDTTFDGDGKATTALGTITDSVNAVAIQSDGKIVLAGSSHDVVTEAPAFAMARFLTDGSLDPSFGGGGKVRTRFRGSQGAANDVVIQADGKIIAGGWASALGFVGNEAVLAQYNTNGTLDTTFGTGGV